MHQAKVAIVVGGTGHIGKALVTALYRSGCKVAVVARHKHSLEELTSLEPNSSSEVKIYQTDVADEIQFGECLKEVKRDFGRVDHIVYTPGITSEYFALADCSTEVWRRTFDVYVTGFFVCFREGLKLIERGGHLVAISSAITRFPSDLLPQVNAGEYAAAKAALDEFVRWARREAHQNGLLLSRVAPGAIDTPFHQDAPAYRKPPAVLPLEVITNKIAEVLLTGQEVDLQIVAEPKQVSQPSVSTMIVAS